jgi:hypothetical protein
MNTHLYLYIYYLYHRIENGIIPVWYAVNIFHLSSDYPLCLFPFRLPLFSIGFTRIPFSLFSSIFDKTPANINKNRTKSVTIFKKTYADYSPGLGHDPTIDI